MYYRNLNSTQPLSSYKVVGLISFLPSVQYFIDCEKLDGENMFRKPDCYGLRFCGMISLPDLVELLEKLYEKSCCCYGVSCAPSGCNACCLTL